MAKKVSKWKVEYDWRGCKDVIYVYGKDFDAAIRAATKKLWNPEAYNIKSINTA